MAKIERFEDIEAWQKARELTSAIYEVSDRGPLAKDYGLRDQMRRASVSIMSNIAEGFERGGNKELNQFVAQAKGSCGEVRAQLYVALDRKYVDEEGFEKLSNMAIEISRMLAGFIRYLRASELKGSKYK